MTVSSETYAEGPAWAAPLFLSLRSFLGIVRLDNPNSAAMPSSRRPRKSSPNESAKLPMTNSPSSSSSSIRNKASSSQASTVVYHKIRINFSEDLRKVTYGFPIGIRQLLLELRQPTSMPHDVIPNEPLHFCYSSCPTFEQRV